MAKNPYETTITKSLAWLVEHIAVMNFLLFLLCLQNQFQTLKEKNYVSKTLLDTYLMYCSQCIVNVCMHEK